MNTKDFEVTKDLQLNSITHGKVSLEETVKYIVDYLSAVYLYVNKASVLETFNIFKNMFVKSAESKSPLELAVWFVVLVLIILLPTRRSA